MVFCVGALLIRQRTQAINASCDTHASGVMRGHLTEFGQIVPQGVANASKLIAAVEDPDSGVPADAVANLKVLVL